MFFKFGQRRLGVVGRRLVGPEQLLGDLIDEVVPRLGGEDESD